MLFGNAKDRPTEKIIEGAVKRVLSIGGKIQVVQLEMKGGTAVPEHAHPHEQAGYIVHGKFEVNIGGEKGILEKGYYFQIPSNTPHSGFVHEDTLLIDIYSPPK